MNQPLYGIIIISVKITFQVIGPIFDAIERISQTAIAALQSVAGTRIHGQEDLHAHYSTLEVISLYPSSPSQMGVSFSVLPS